jgi:glycosyltransferase involved in cell wall biosynthesis
MGAGDGGALMRLVMLDQYSDLGGAQQGLLELLPELRNRGWQALIGLPGDGEVCRRACELGFKVEPIVCGPYRAGRKSLADAGRFLWQTPALMRQIRGMAERWRAEVIYINGPRLMPAAPPGLPVVFHAHSYLGAGAVRDIAGMALRRTGAHLIANCEFVAETWSGYVAPQHVSVVYNGVGGPDRPPVPRLSAAHPVVASLGRIAPEKGQLDFLKAAAAIHSAIPAARFDLIGAPLFGDTEAERYHATVRSAAAHLPVEFHGWREDVYHALAGIDLLLVPSASHEATTRVILEAYSAGVPVVALRSGGVPEVVDHGVTGFLAGSVPEMAERAIELLRHPARRAEMAREARAAWERRFTLDRYRSDVLAALHRAATAGKAEPPLPPAPPHRPESAHSPGA